LESVEPTKELDVRPSRDFHAEQQLDQVVSPVEFFLVEMLSCPSFGMKTPLHMAKNQTKIRKQH
jgi:hypothetical protein